MGKENRVKRLYAESLLEMGITMSGSNPLRASLYISYAYATYKLINDRAGIARCQEWLPSEAIEEFLKTHGKHVDSDTKELDSVDFSQTADDAIKSMIKSSFVKIEAEDKKE